MTKPFRFAIQAYRSTSKKEWCDLARKVEATGYSALHLADHYLGPGPAIADTGHRVQMIAAIPAMTAAAMVTDTLRIGSRMLCVGYHHPTILAKEVATIDMLSEGRLELGLGAGWLVNEYEALGIPFPSAGERITLLRETVEMMKQAFSGQELDYRGSLVHAVGYEQVPAPIQQPHPPIMIGGGAPKVLGLAGELADIVSVNFNNSSGKVGSSSISSSTAEETVNKLAWIKAGAGDRFDQLTLETGAYFVSVEGRSDLSAADISARIGLEGDDLTTFPHALVGSVDQIVDELQRRREVYGFSYITVGDAHVDAFAPVVAALAGK